ncbi:MAG: aminotransferase class III-fold pyridoxal phosphate-dependent enzyme [Verrucomicrobia bacterium]|nr:aminotransferase class III-fold pyridoxal phosphate-dependent enzyme [Verrucomicrobiota bacterium]
MHKLARLDHAHVWHPFTQMRDWLRSEPIVITSGLGAVLRDVRGREYLDANSSIWTNLHGHNHPKLNAALRKQLGKIAHSSALGFANEPAGLLAAKLVSMAGCRLTVDGRRADDDARPNRKSEIGNRELQKVFFSDDGSTAMEVALKLAYEFTRRARGPKTQPRFISLAGAYHGDTVGAVSLGHIDLFHKAHAGLLFKTDAVMSPYCYRCPFNRAKPERADARETRKCNWECVGKVEAKCAAARKRGNDYAAFVFEPLMQGAAGMIPQPAGWLKRVTDIARGHGALLVADEVMTGFGRTGGGESGKVRKRESERDATARLPTFPPAHFLTGSASQGVQPDFLALAKGLTGGYLPMAATLTTQAVFDAFLGEYAEFKTFFHGHSFTGNQLGAAAGLASLELLTSKASVTARTQLEENLRRELKSLWSLPNVGDVRQVGMVAGVELVHDWRTREPFALDERAGIRVCEAMVRRGVLTRPIGSVVVLMPPYCTTAAQVRRMVGALYDSVEEVLGARATTSGAR